MSSKSYTMREMKDIVDYLTEHKAYSEIKGRKMWMDFASSQLTNRTWQSLKETFLKRILPDILNPYYQLDVDQIQSFKRGLDLTRKDKEKLIFEPVGEESMCNKGAKRDIEQPSTSKNNDEDNATGEDTTCSKLVHNRASTETLILDNCYETAEDIQRDLERSADEDQENEMKKNEKNPAKSVRDFIVYSEPLTPMLQEVLDDFATDEESSDREPPMEIDENYVCTSERRSNSPKNAPQSQSILQHEAATDTAKATSECERNNYKSNHDDEKQVTENQVESTKNTEQTTHSQLEDVMVLVDEALAKDLDSELNSQKVDSQDKTRSSNEASSAMTDTLIPNNQEGINTRTLENHSIPPLTDVNEDQPSKKRKHSGSVEIVETSKKIHTEPLPNTDAIQDKPEIQIIENNIENDKTELTLNTTDPNVQSRPKKMNGQKDPSHDEIVFDVNSDSSTSKNNQSSSQVVNPCLKSVSLYDEQFCSSKYSDPDLNDKEDNVKAQKAQEKSKMKSVKAEAELDVILLKSHSNSESDDKTSVSDKPLARSSLKMQKDKKLASVFGFTNGGRNTPSKSRRQSGRKRTTSHRNQHYASSESSEWTSASDSEFVSPPRGRRNRYTRKYLKPQSARIRSLDEEGGLFVMLGKKIYPLVRDGKIIKNLSYLPESDPEDEDSYWKSKYVEERKRTAELKKMIEQAKQNGTQSTDVKDLPVIAPQIQNQQKQSVQQESVNGNELVTRKECGPVEKPDQEKTVKIKFTKLDQEVQLEGHWQHLNPVLAQVVSMFHKEPSINNKPAKRPDDDNLVELSSGNTTPSVIGLDAGIKEKVNDMESSIFKEIEEKDEKDKEDVKPETTQEKTPEYPEDETNVNLRKRRGRPKKDSAQAVQSPTTNTTYSIESGSKSNDVEKIKEQEIKDGTPSSPGRKTRTPRKFLDVSTHVTEKRNAKRVSTVKKSLQAEDEEILYKFPSPPPEKRSRKRTTDLSKNAKETAQKHLKHNVTSPENLSHHSINSSQGYQDSDTSPFHIGIRKKRRQSASTLSIKGRKLQRKHRSNSYPCLVKNVSESSNSPFNISVKTVTREQSTINSEVYRSESYRFLMPRNIIERLEKIDETTTIDPDLGNVKRMVNTCGEIEVITDHVQSTKSDIASSSSLSLPLSPELSLVENLSISKSALAANGDHLTINQMQSNTAPKTFDNKYLISQVDVSMPLMAQECGLRESYRKHIMTALSNLSDLGDIPNSAGRNFPSGDSSALVSSMSESILNKIFSVNIKESPSDSLDRRLEELLLESAQKPKKNPNQQHMEIDTHVKKQSGSRKRCSTPNKKISNKNKKKVPNDEPLVEEEYKAHCSRTGRRSCPPSINIVYYENNAPKNVEISIHDQSIDVTTVTKRKSIKKDVIKVKILRPKDKPQNKRISQGKKGKSKVHNGSQTSGNTEYDNESGVFLQGFDDSEDLIHNHSETCLQIKDCMGDSVEFIAATSKSIISLNSSESRQGKENGDAIRAGKGTPHLFCDNAQCALDFHDEIRSASSGNTLFFTPLMSKTNSILTEDLSDEALNSSPVKSAASKWYLVSEEETDFHDACSEDRNDLPGFGANLKQLFPITCAIPDLSTITEMSDRTENSQKPSLEPYPIDCISPNI